MPKYFYISILLFVSLFGGVVFAETVSELQGKIDLRNSQIKQLEAEISKYNAEVESAGKQAKTLQNTIKTLDLTKKKLLADLALTQNKISRAEMTIQQLDDEIASTSGHIDRNKNAIGQMLRSVQSLDDVNTFETILSSKNFGDAWNDIDNIKNIQEKIYSQLTDLRQLKTEMDEQQSKNQAQKNQLVGLKTDLNGKKQVVENTTQQKATLLAQTKNKESAFQALVKTKEEQKAQFEKDLYEYESQLNFLIDKNSYPKPKNGVLSWPLDNVYITQKFGRTVGAEKLYTSGSHNGVDFRASVGTPVKSVLSGVVAGTGNTDAYPGCYSFGKWVMVTHENGLSTVYGHLSAILTSKGQNVSTGDVLGYSGNTGYSTGPHLHLGLYATQGVRVEQYVNSKGCKQATIPIADVRAYLDPLAYLPNL